jgi:cobalt-zinc-cadmium efflux system outer membrane protein
MGHAADATTGAVSSFPSLTIEQAINEAVQNNLNLLAERMNLTIAEASLITASLRPNPVLSLSADHQDFLGTGFSRHNGAGPQEFSWRIDVPMERGNKREYRMAAATLAKEVAEVQLLESTRKLILDVALACVDVLQAKANVKLASDNLHMFEEFVRLNTVKVKDGAIAPVELMRSQVAMQQYHGNVKRAELTLATAKTKLQNLLGRNVAEDTIDISGELQSPLQPRDLQLAILQEQAFTARPDIRMLERSQARSQADLKLQLAQAKVDYTWGVEYLRQQGVNGMGNTLGLFFSVPIPIFSRNQGEIARVQAESEQLSRQLQALKAQVQAEIKVATEEFQSSRNLVESIEREMLQPATQARDTVAYTYRSGASSLVEFLDAQRAFNETMQSYYETQANYRRAVMKLNVTLGKEVTAS